MLDNSAELTVQDVMLTSPKALPGTSTVGDLRAAFENSHLRTALLVDGSTFLGTVRRDAMPAGAESDGLLATTIANRDVPTVTPETSVSQAMRILDEDGGNRLPVLDSNGQTLRGLLCLTSDREGFCR